MRRRERVTWEMRLVFNMSINGYSFRTIGKRIGKSRQRAHQLYWSYIRIRQAEWTARIVTYSQLETAYKMVIDGLNRLIQLETTTTNQAG